ncbi:MAG: hypothetical protein KDD44_09745 [Bdellovibrionales bacterium]|nr:hypothetical protein [Bdellovibrionales bacterium]
MGSLIFLVAALALVTLCAYVPAESQMYVAFLATLCFALSMLSRKKKKRR